MQLLQDKRWLFETILDPTSQKMYVAYANICLQKNTKSNMRYNYRNSCQGLFKVTGSCLR